MDIEYEGTCRQKKYHLINNNTKYNASDSYSMTWNGSRSRRTHIHATNSMLMREGDTQINEAISVDQLSLTSVDVWVSVSDPLSQVLSVEVIQVCLVLCCRCTSEWSMVWVEQGKCKGNGWRILLCVWLTVSVWWQVNDAKIWSFRWYHSQTTRPWWGRGRREVREESEMGDEQGEKEGRKDHN